MIGKRFRSLPFIFANDNYTLRMKLAIDEAGILYYDIEVRFFADTESDYDK